MDPRNWAKFLPKEQKQQVLRLWYLIVPVANIMAALRLSRKLSETRE
jgi:hypothetical protein